jgi:hypothetical protein
VVNMHDWELRLSGLRYLVDFLCIISIHITPCNRRVELLELANILFRRTPRPDVVVSADEEEKVHRSGTGQMNNRRSPVANLLLTAVAAPTLVVGSKMGPLGDRSIPFPSSKDAGHVDLCFRRVLRLHELNGAETLPVRRMLLGRERRRLGWSFKLLGSLKLEEVKVVVVWGVCMVCAGDGAWHRGRIVSVEQVKR